jgi:hypothetical protein
MGKLEIIHNPNVKIFLIIPLEEEPDKGFKRQFAFYWKHIGEKFEARAITYCRYANDRNNSNLIKPCHTCLGYVQAPWMSRPACWGLKNKMVLQQVKEEE